MYTKDTCIQFQVLSSATNAPRYIFFGSYSSIAMIWMDLARRVQVEAIEATKAKRLHNEISKSL